MDKNITKKIGAYAEEWLKEHGTACENGLDADIGLRVKRWFFEDVCDAGLGTSLEALRESVNENIAHMVWQELGEAIEDLKSL